MMNSNQLNSINETPSKTPKKFINKVLANCDSPFGILPNFSTPPSKFTEIKNPFESHILERLHLSTFSPSVFAQESTPKTEEKFKWSIDDISYLKPAQIDENTISQHVTENDPKLESMLQEKISQFFTDKVIVPSPMNEEVKRMALITNNSSPIIVQQQKQFSDGHTQTALSLPPILPAHIEEILKPYFIYPQDQEGEETELNENTSLYRKLFVFDDEGNHSKDNVSIQSSPALSTGLSPIQFSPVHHHLKTSENNRNFDSPSDLAELNDCNLSPIGRSPRECSRSVCRLSFSEQMSIDNSMMLVPDINKTTDNNICLDQNSIISFTNESQHNSVMNWDVEYKNVSFISTSTNMSQDEELVVEDNMTNANTPHAKIFASQRKRLSDSFKEENCIEQTELQDYNNQISKNKLFRDDITDGGYHSGGIVINDTNLTTWNISNMFASTPTKNT